ncbi:hypothetical protein DKX38_026260 [Salix brachista]|uniref:3-hydroxyisobutyrate dehydrogenase n=1 Tax=Salix brachista TaxID=2182728 RepID=A0A5N5JR64_9ROSI|nr:hypothetical protein DKX38_026260 [Salix brachista]
MAICRARASLSLLKTKSPFFQYVPLHGFSSSHFSSQFESVGFIGLGNMGSRMANNLIKNGYKVAVHDIGVELSENGNMYVLRGDGMPQIDVETLLNCNVMKMFSDMGVSTKETPFEVAEASDVVITMLPSSSHVLDVYTGPNGVLRCANLMRPQLLIDSSTIDPRTSRTVSVAVSNCILKEKKDHWEKPVMLDAPVSGGVLAAEAGTLTFMVWFLIFLRIPFHFLFLSWFHKFSLELVGFKAARLETRDPILGERQKIFFIQVGGSEDAYLAAKPLFLSMGKNAIYCGGAGTGSAAKICNNLAMAVSMLGVSEAFALGQSLGISAGTLTKVLNTSSARCWSSDSYNPVPGVMEGVPASRNYAGGFASKLMAKDLNLAATSVEEAGLQCPLTYQAHEIYTELCKDGHEIEDFSCVFRHYYSGKDEL